MVRSGSKRSDLNAVSVESPTREILPNAKTREISPGRPSREKSSRERRSLLRRRRSKRNNNLTLSNPWTEDLADGGVSNHDALTSLAKPSTLEIIPSHWETASGKFDPRISEFAFDNTSNMAINVNLHSGVSTNSIKSGSNDSEYSHKSPLSLSDDNEPKTNKHKSKKGESSALVEGELVDHIERHQFYKKLKKAGIKKTLAIDEDWTNSSACSGFSALSAGNASYILDLAQQKESRQKDREEVALEEALELYGTWLMEGKNDDKNIFLMILHEVKKEQKAKHKKADKRHAALLDAALDEELKRRAQIKEEEEEEERIKAVAAAAEAAAAQKKSDDSVTAKSSHRRHKFSRGSLTRKSFHSKQSESKIVEILRTQSFISKNNDKESSDGSFHEEHSEAFEHTESSEIYDDDVPKPSSKRSRSRSRNSRRSSIFSYFGSNADKMDQPHLRQSDPQMYANSAPRNQKEDSKRMFSRLRRQLSARELEQRKEEENSWKKNDRVVTNEEKWWAKINDAKKENAMFEKGKLDMTTRSNPFGEKSPMKPNTAVKLDLTTRTAPGRMPNTKDGSNSTNNPSNSAQFTVTSTATSPTVETKKKVKDEKKKLSSPKPKKKKKATSVSDLLNESKEVNSEKKKKKKKKASETGDSSSVVSDFDGQKLPKSKDKKKKKKSKVVEGDEKKEKTSKGGSKNVSVIGSVDGSDAKSSSRSGRKKNIKGSVGENSDAETSPTKKSHNKIAKKKKKKARSSVGSASDDAIHSDNHGQKSSCDWTHNMHRCSPV